MQTPFLAAFPLPYSPPEDLFCMDPDIGTQGIEQEMSLSHIQTRVFSTWKPVCLADGKWEEAGHGGEASSHASGTVNWENTYFVI